MVSLHLSSYFHIFQSLYQSAEIVLSAPITICFTVTFMFHSFFFSSRASSRYLSPFLAFFHFHSVACRNGKVQYSAGSSFLLFFWQSLCLVVWPRLHDRFVSQNPSEFCVSHFPGLVLGCAYTSCSNAQISIFCIIPGRSPCPPSHV